MVDVIWRGDNFFVGKIDEQCCAVFRCVFGRNEKVSKFFTGESAFEQGIENAKARDKALNDMFGSKK